MATPKLIPNMAAIQQLAETKEMARAMGDHAKAAADNARAIAPVMSGDYREGIESEAVIENGKAVGKVHAKDFKSRWIEFGTVRTAARSCLRRGAEMAGLKVGPPRA